MRVDTNFKFDEERVYVWIWKPQRTHACSELGYVALTIVVFFPISQPNLCPPTLSQEPI